jgi:hypothetical protein
VGEDPIVTAEDSLIVHLVNAPMRPGTLNRRVMVSATVAGLAAVAAAVLRVLGGGQSLAFLLTSLLAALLIVCLLFLYALLRVRNAALYVRGDRIGISNALGIRNEIPIAMLDHIRKDVVASAGLAPTPALLIVTKDPKKTLTFRGADRLESGGIDRVASLLNQQIQGSWELPK